MEYFNEVLIPENKQYESLNKFDQIKELIAKVEHRALAVANERQPYLQNITAKVIIDPYGHLSPEDHNQWIDLLYKAENKSLDLYSRLFYLRGAGTKLIPNNQWGYIFEPVIGKFGWDSLEFYNQEKLCLEPFSNEIIYLLKELI